MSAIDEKKIEEIVAKVLERLGGEGKTTAAPHRVPVAAEHPRKASIPRGTNGVYADADQAAKEPEPLLEQADRRPHDRRQDRPGEDDIPSSPSLSQ